MANKKRETAAQKAARERQEKIDILKMKQGLIEESENVPESGYVKIPELHGWEKFTNFLYLNKAFLIWGTVFVFIIALCLGQFIFRERFDLHVLVVSSSHESELNWRYTDIEKALEKYCSDFDGNGKINVTINQADRDITGEVLTEDEQINQQRLKVELQSAKAQLIIADEGFVDYFTEQNPGKECFIPQTDKFPEEKLYKNVGIRMNQTQLAETMYWKDCPDDVVILVRAELDDGSGSAKKNAEYREHAQEVLQNILDGNIVNPDPESSE